MKKLIVFLVLLLGISAFSNVTGSPGDYSLRAKIGPGFSINDWTDQVKIGGEFDYELGYSLGIGLLTLISIDDTFRFSLMPSIRRDLLYIGPANFFAVAGLGYGRLDGDDSLDMRIGTGVVLPLGDEFELMSDVNLFMSPVGTPGFPVTLEWLLGFGIRFD